MITIVLCQYKSTWLTGIVLAAFGLLAGFPQVYGPMSHRLLSTRWRAGLFDRPMQSGRGEKSGVHPCGETGNKELVALVTLFERGACVGPRSAMYVADFRLIVSSP